MYKAKKQRKFSKEEIIYGDIDLNIRFSVFFRKSRFYREFKADQKKKFSDFRENFIYNILNLSIFKRNDDKWYVYIIKLLFFYHIFIYLYNNLIEYYRLYINYIFDFFIVFLNVISYRFRFMYLPSTRWDIEKLRRSFLMKNFISNVRNLFYVKKNYKFGDVDVKVSKIFIFFTIIGNIFNFFTYGLPIILSFISIFFRFLISFFEYYVFSKWVYIYDYLVYILNYIFNFFFFFFVYYPLRFFFWLKIRKFFFLNWLKKKINISISSEDLENIIDIMKENNINYHDLNNYFKNIFGNMEKNKIYTFNEMRYLKLKKNWKEQRSILVSYYENLIVWEFFEKMCKFYVIFYFFQYLISFFKLVFFYIKWFVLFIISCFFKRY